MSSTADRAEPAAASAEAASPSRRSRGGAPPAPSGGRRRRGRILRRLAALVAAALLATAAAGWLYYQHLNHNLRKGQRSSSSHVSVPRPKPNAAGQTPVNILLIGSDGRDSADDLALGGSRENAGGPARADVEMLLHLSADRKHAALVSVPRDTRTTIPECTDPATGHRYPPVNTIINESLARGGPGCTLATWEKLTGVWIDHWVLVDFAGVVRMADAIGGVEVCVKQNLWDRPTPAIPHGGSGLKLTAGTHTVQGEQALQWLRTRDSFGSDLGRAEAQHMYLASMLRSLRSQDVFGDAGRLMDLADAATRSLRVSEEIGSVKDLYDLATQFQDIPSDQVTMVTMPNITDPQDDDHLLPDPVDAPKVWSMLRNDVPFDGAGKQTAGTGASASPSAGTSPSAPTVTPTATASATGAAAPDPGTVAVTVVNGTADGDGGQVVPGRAGDVAHALAGHGFTRAAASEETASQQGSGVTYPAGGGGRARADALAVARALGLPAGAVRAAKGSDPVTVTVGADWPEGTDYRSTLPQAVPTSADVLHGDDRHACMDVYKPYRW
ncbi:MULTISPECIES: LCP family protein [Streptomycetaceae]|uniref:Transcriptional regulator n=1 Tax=Streptantibioticus cattleyicolor (strain ATCC 35852 / DSM 46488 / JCM 4925 / NBRC 14057 / NRRL 8057) TaxID=1003195 RepID=F8JVC5_STREN|nr:MULTISPECIES: LCP family protein [Streptomycetaceae]AEW94403.1 hypothetical protein SCATT_20320 [Streptantibioticus cattleyicolor NRRL 8057 = DSM 46488]MYS59052.1 LytR family transcriptional regulator [Streptomyces sp. SID5468]CCB74762.1 Transcriptional regulator [Streptantibioticus cattleyicolor NRRL 8057 = DSM 46488]